MWVTGLLLLLGFLSFAVGEGSSSVPECARSCWENTKYVSRCLNDLVCLCRDDGYQNSLFQCLYSQCDTAHFGSGLHFALSQCFDYGSQIKFGARPFPKHDDLRKRKEAEYLAGRVEKRYVSGVSGVLFPTESTGFPMESGGFPTQSGGFLTQSAGYPTNSANFPTQSVSYRTQSIDNPLAVSPSPMPDFLIPREIEETPTTVAMLAATPTEAPDINLALSRRLETLTSIARSIGPCFALHFLSTIVVVYFTL